MRVFWAIMIGLGLTACAPEAPTSGVGFSNYDEYARERAQREATLEGGITPGMVVSGEPVGEGVTPAQPSAVAGTIGADPDAGDPVELAAAAPAGDPNNPDISDEQNFDAVSSRESIESDRERLERNRALYVVIEPTELPRRPGTDIPNIVAYALATNNAVGQQLYPRGPFNNAETTARNCKRFVSPDMAQEAFLSSGGPKRDRRGLDPDGDGFACAWDPAKFRQIRG